MDYNVTGTIGLRSRAPLELKEGGWAVVNNIRIATVRACYYYYCIIICIYKICTKYNKHNRTCRIIDWNFVGIAP